MHSGARDRVIFHVLRRMRLPLLLLIVVYAVSMIGLVLIPGVDAAGRPLRMDFFHAFYVVTYTISTIGFGELPQAFSAAQRLWMTFTIYLGVTAWLYGIGALIALLQEPAFRQVLRAGVFAAAVRRQNQPFYIVCGYGDTGGLVVQEMVEHGLHAVVLDIDPERINELTLEDLRSDVPGYNADAADPASLELAGLRRANCAGVVAITNHDAVNLKIAITVKLLRPELPVICRAETHDAQANMASFGTDATINPFDAFADRLAMAVHSPDLYLLTEWLTQPPGKPLPLRYQPPRGTWVLCGYGRFGKAVQRYLQYEGVQTVIIEKDLERTQAPPGTVHGRGNETTTLREAHVENAVGVVAGTDDDANNLSIIITARHLNPNLFLVGRQNLRQNDSIFAAARIDLTMQRSRIIANRILSLISTPLLTDFLREARHQSEQWVAALVERLWPMTANRTPDLWTVQIDPPHAPVVHAALSAGHTVRLRHLLADPGARDERLPGLALLVERDEDKLLLPDEDLTLCKGDRILFCGRLGVEDRQRWTLNNRNSLRYVVTGEVRPEGLIWRWLKER